MITNALAREMQEEKLPEEFIETILTGWWSTCFEVLPAKERRRREILKPNDQGQ